MTYFPTPLAVNEFYPHVALLTQSVVDAVAKSAGLDGARVLLTEVTEHGGMHDDSGVEESKGGNEVYIESL